MDILRDLGVSPVCLPAQGRHKQLMTEFLNTGPVLKICLNFIFIYIRVQLINNVVLVLGIKQSDSVTHISILFQTLSPYRFVHNTEYNPLCFIVCFIYSSVYMLIPNSNLYIYLIFPPFPFCIYTYLLFIRFFSLRDYYIILSIVPCAIQQIHVGYLFHIK